ncbi:hypothetical protein GE061_003364 [Apolygus lucorum]|uniref:Uncharacterized protein n=1 Tax=Apolygus lucorum TaxID=248454 RepID=A0A8S9X4E3_APOLU|nr:hypothetical protein GE061_003364 [Apolygus lucorum]
MSGTTGERDGRCCKPPVSFLLGYEERPLFITKVSGFCAVPMTLVPPKLSIKKMEELTYMKKGETTTGPFPQIELRQVHPKQSVPNYRNFCIRSDTGLSSVKGKSLLQAAMEWKKPVDSSSETLILPDQFEPKTEADPLHDSRDGLTDEEDAQPSPETEDPPDETSSLIPVFAVGGQKMGTGDLYTSGDGYYYRRKTRTSFQMICIHKKSAVCPARASLKELDGKFFIIPRFQHSCVANPLLTQSWALRKKIIKRCATDLETPFLQIFCEETSSPNVPEKVREALNFETILSSMVKNRSLRMKEIQGQKSVNASNIGSPKRAEFFEDSKLFTDGLGYFYKQKPPKSNNLRCSRIACGGRALLKSGTENGTLYLIERKRHSCKPDIHIAEIRKLKSKIFKRCENDVDVPLHQIYREETSSPGIPKAVLSAISFRSLSTHMYRLRQMKCKELAGQTSLGTEVVDLPLTGDSMTATSSEVIVADVESEEECFSNEESEEDSSD